MGGPYRQPARGVPIGRLPVAGRPPPGSRRGAEGLLRSPSGRAGLTRRRGGRAGSATSTRSLPAIAALPRSSPALAPEFGLRQRSGGTRAAPGARVSGRARLPGFSPAPPPAFASAAAARRGGVCMGSALGHREGQGGETCLWGEVGSLPGGAPSPAGRVGTGGAGRAGRFVSGRGDRQQAAAPPSAAPFASLPCSPGRPHAAGSAG